MRKELGRTKPVCLMDIATVAVKYLKPRAALKAGRMEEINACTVKPGECRRQGRGLAAALKTRPTTTPPKSRSAGGNPYRRRNTRPASGRSYVCGAMRVARRCRSA
ncbi:MAG: hypothetical protein ACLR56_03365 [Oscillospiraceae bacterium]